MAGTDPTPMKTSTAVPISSARSFWGNEFSAMIRPTGTRRASHLLRRTGERDKGMACDAVGDGRFRQTGDKVLRD
ncbi:hypothetical protein GCM10009839_41790 [Catenulispora yoronensis]|uniref:Uncharacterized protein n=1 Tax=Catenulispora yoronensis TaxID=450799 RepID=A0ABN2UGS6_9ACTN